MVEANENLGMSLREVRDYEAATLAFDAAALLNPARANPHFLKGNLLAHKLDRSEEAVVAFDAGIAASAKEQPATKYEVISGIWHNKGAALVRLGRQDEAKTLWKQGAAKNFWPNKLQHGGTDLQRGLRAESFWEHRDLGAAVAMAIAHLQDNWQLLRD